MSATLSRKQQKAATRRELLAAAQRVFVARGVRNTAVGDISKAAGVAHGTFYVHFDSKEQLVRELLANLNAELAQRIGRSISPGATRDLPRLIRRVATAFLDQLEQRRDLIACVADHLVTELSLADVRDGVNPPVQELLASALTALARQRGAPVANVDVVCHALLAMWLRVGLRQLFLTSSSRERTLDLLVNMTVATVDAALPPRKESAHA